GGANGWASASGLGGSTTVLPLLSAGDHVVAGTDLYGGTYRLFERVFRQMGLSFTYVDPAAGPAAFAAAVTDQTRLVWIETPTNPMLKLCDLAGVADAVKQKKRDAC